ncbi:hypothetical protein Trichorick_00162 [Candidatus Trichorickettsia mobilis]|uniref:Uncharacterized protein n=1 Tax=Candidatus Trichorickettsia mobilis TaxID=1346319 RepID=A0ABZ0UQG6_9RICK|nr:hypothetical protein [Candidatus Trichorickettsia mobilis]WPY00290.1 hypothetical protein Trichorick_00162 [Candidatus Trichorickettsia mobilis]
MKKIYNFQQEDSIIDITSHDEFTNFLQSNQPIDLSIEYKGERLIDHVLTTKSTMEVQQIFDAIINQIFASKTLIIDFNTPDQNGKSLFSKLYEKYSVSQANEIEELLNQLLTISNFSKNFIDWNQHVDVNGNSLMLALAQNPNHHIIVNSFISAVNAEKLSLFKINQINNAGEKLIDVFKKQLDANQIIDISIFTKLRELGSGEPKSLFVPVAAKLDTANVHNQINEQPIKNMQQELHGKYNAMSELEIKDALTEIEQYININKNENNIIQLLEGALEISAIDALQNFNMLKNDTGQHNEHNNIWIFPTEFAYIWQESKQLGLQNLFVQKLSELGGCFWGQLLNMYQTLEKDEIVLYRPVMPFEKLFSDEAFLNDVTNKAFMELEKLGLSKATIKNIANNWYKEQIKTAKDHELSVESELLLGIFNKIFKEMVGNTTLYSQDYKGFFTLMNGVVANYEYSDPDSNIFYQILKASSEEIIEEKLKLGEQEQEIIFEKKQVVSEKKEELEIISDQSQKLELIDTSEKVDVIEIIEKPKQFFIEEETKELVIKQPMKQEEVEFDFGAVMATKALLQQLNGANTIMLVEQFIKENQFLDLTLPGEQDRHAIFDLLNKTLMPEIAQLIEILTSNPNIKIYWGLQDMLGNSALMKLYQKACEANTVEAFDSIAYILTINADIANQLLNIHNNEGKTLFDILNQGHQIAYKEMLTSGLITQEVFDSFLIEQDQIKLKDISQSGTGALNIVDNRQNLEELKIMVFEQPKQDPTIELIKQLNVGTAVMQLEQFIVQNGVLDLTSVGEQGVSVVFDLFNKIQGPEIAQVTDMLITNPNVKIHWQQQDLQGNTTLMQLYQKLSLVNQHEALDPIALVLFQNQDHMQEIIAPHNDIGQSLLDMLTIGGHRDLYNEMFVDISGQLNIMEQL